MKTKFRGPTAPLVAQACLALLLSAIGLSSCGSPGTPPLKYALVWGLNYAGRNAALNYCQADATAMAALFTDQGYVVRLRLGAEATRAGLTADIADIGAAMGPDDTFLFYYSGHGIEILSTDMGYPSAMRGHEAVVPDDAYTASGIVAARLVLDTDLGAMLGTLPSARKVVILDSCNSGGFIGSGADVSLDPASTVAAPAPLTASLIAEAARAWYSSWSAPTDGIAGSEAIVIGAAGARELSWEDGTRGHGIFTYYLLQAPRSGDLDGDGLVTALEAYWLARTAVQTHWNANLTASSTAFFTPRVSGGPCDLVLFRSRSTP